MKTPEEIEELKRQWKQDPCWDIFSTEGFEDHVTELTEFQEKYNAEQMERYERELERYCISIGYTYPEQKLLAEHYREFKNELTKIKDILNIY